MSAAKKDPTEAICNKARQYAGVEEGSSCTQASFKVGKNAFLYIGMQGGRYKAMFKLKDSKQQAERLAMKEPSNFAVGHTAWVTARFTAEKPLPKKVWEKWLAESYQLSGLRPKSAKATKKKATKKKATKKKSTKKKATKKKATKKKATKKKATKKKATKKKATKKRATKKKASKKAVTRKR